MSYFLQPTGCGGRVIEAKVEDYLARYDVPAREKTDVRWAQTCMDLEDVVEPLDAALEPPLRRRMQAKLWQALYFKSTSLSWRKTSSGWAQSCKN